MISGPVSGLEGFECTNNYVGVQSCRVFHCHRPACSRKLLVCSDGGRNRLLRHLSTTDIEWNGQYNAHNEKTAVCINFWQVFMIFGGSKLYGCLGGWSLFFSCRILVSLSVVVVKWCVSGWWKFILLVTWPSLSVSKEKKRRCRWLMQSYTCPLWCAFLSCLSGFHIVMEHLCNRRTGLHFCLFFPKQHQLMWSTPINTS